MLMHEYLLKKKHAITMGSNQWFVPRGLTIDNVLAAYQCVGQVSAEHALRDLGMYGHDLKNVGNVAWSSDTGFTFKQCYQSGNQALQSSALNDLDIKCCILRYADITISSRCFLMSAGGSKNTARIYGATSGWGEWYSNNGHHKRGNGHLLVTNRLGYARNSKEIYYNNDKNGSFHKSGIVGANFSEDKMLFYNGAKLQSATTKTESMVGYEDDGEHKEELCTLEMSLGTGKRTFGNAHPNASDLNNAQHAGWRLIAAAFFNVPLTASEHAEVAENMSHL